VLARQIRRLHQALAAPASALERDVLFQEMAVALATRHADSRPRLRSVATGRPALARVREFLHDNVAVDISAEDLAGVAGMSRFHVSRQFRRAYGMPPHAYLLKLRLAEARRLIAAGEPAALAAAGSGFVDQSHLSKRFKGAFGITPGQYARAVRGAVTPR
jgi:AraC-like DNA-binding protein